MRPDQYERLKDLSEKLADTFLLEADPAEWPGDGKPPADLTQQERGDRYWAKKNAMATGGALRFTLDIMGKQAPTVPTEGEGSDDMDDQIRAAEKRAAVAVKRAMDKAAGKTEFDKRVHGSKG